MLPSSEIGVPGFGNTERVQATVVQDEHGTECVNCGNITPELMTVCPNCQFRDIAPCSYCNHEIPRLEYTPISGDLFECPSCRKRVRLQFQDPPFNGNGEYKQPSPAASHDLNGAERPRNQERPKGRLATGERRGPRPNHFTAYLAAPERCSSRMI
jgi:hypothetical protein